MNQYKLKELVLSFLYTCILLVVLEVFSATFLPSVGLSSYILSFHILVVLFIGFRVQTIYQPYLILMVELIHSVFTIEGWAIGTLAGIIVTSLISYLKDMIQLNSRLSTIIVVQIFQVIWFVLVSSLISIKLGDFSYILTRFWRFLPESFLLSLISPFFFIVLMKFWGTKKSLKGVRI